MPSPPFDTSWDFGAALHLIDSSDEFDAVDTPPTPLQQPNTDSRDVLTYDAFKSSASPESPLAEGGGVSLGNFDKVWKVLGTSGESAPLPSVDEEPISSDDAGCFSVGSDNERSGDEGAYLTQGVSGVGEEVADAAHAAADESDAAGTGVSRKRGRKRGKKGKRNRTERAAYSAGELLEVGDGRTLQASGMSAAGVVHPSEPVAVAITPLDTSRLPNSMHLTPLALAVDPTPTFDIPPSSTQHVLPESSHKSISELSQSLELPSSDPRLFSSQVKALTGLKPNGTSTPSSTSNGLHAHPQVSSSGHDVPRSTPSLLGYLVPHQVAQAAYLSTSYHTGYPNIARSELDLAQNHSGTKPKVQYAAFGTLVRPTSDLSLLPVPRPIGSIPVFNTTKPHLGADYSATGSLVSANRTAEKIHPRSREELHCEFLFKLIDRFPEDKRWLVSPFRQLRDNDMSPEGIHVFIDKSNITIGFSEMLKLTGRRPCNMSFECLCLLLERRRPVAKRVLAGSEHGLRPQRNDVKFNSQAGELGYEQNIFARVHKVKEPSPRSMHWSRTGELQYSGGAFGGGSDSETGAPTAAAAVTRSSWTTTTKTTTTTAYMAPKWVEQGVDENLHLKMCNSILDAESPSTMVLATGDGNEAEFSDGFLAHVERALKKGWKVELVAWRKSIHGGYYKTMGKWGERFRIVELDEWLEFMMDVEG
ncbi:uncharacterized protein EI97DRAFT_502412 [Westerdykella ornata]|uniref:NYN domain-containing protein n=1 Tax=Westerdykella ornata TaxID=318751 RepID=A0A6A6JEN3_WESOR|nr:uncharacterized protein EI97DRAFT_502412 [Westerdykella ornata]KAF2274872.1 hypothetical protein EI97DRAFT_502412 [Westerdykella ornata]